MTRPAIRPLALALALAAGPALSAQVRDCDTPIANARNLAQPFGSATRQFGEGAISFLSLRLDEPACCGAHLMVLFPDAAEGFQSCRIVTSDDGSGWGSIDLEGARASYDPARGLTVDVPLAVFEGDGFAPRRVEVVVDRARASVTATER